MSDIAIIFGADFHVEQMIIPSDFGKFSHKQIKAEAYCK